MCSAWGNAVNAATAALGLLLLGTVAGGPAAAEDYPYSGFFAQLPDEALADTQLACANGFFRQGRDGSFINYHLDSAGYDRDGTVRYVQYGSGQCTLLDGGRIESCKMAFSTDPAEIGAAYIDVIRAIGPDAIDVSFFDDVETARASLAGAEAPVDDSRFVRCAGFTDEALGGALTTDVSRLSLDDRDELLSPELDAETRARQAAILDRLLHKP